MQQIHLVYNKGTKESDDKLLSSRWSHISIKYYGLEMCHAVG